MPKTYHVVTHHLPGCLSEADPVWFEDKDEAEQYRTDEAAQNADGFEDPYVYSLDTVTVGGTYTIGQTPSEVIREAFNASAEVNDGRGFWWNLQGTDADAAEVAGVTRDEWRNADDFVLDMNRLYDLWNRDDTDIADEALSLRTSALDILGIEEV